MRCAARYTDALSPPRIAYFPFIVRIVFNYGTRQQLRYRFRDLAFQGRVEGARCPVARAHWRLNGAAPQTFYVEAIVDPGIDWVMAYKQSPAELRCKDQGDFTVELPHDHPALRAGENRIEVEIEDAGGARCASAIDFSWDPTPLPLPLDLRDLTRYQHIQQIGQTVIGAFDLDAAQNVIRSRAPVYPDSLLVLGSPHASQEATYAVRFLDFRGVKWLGPSDFYVGFEAKEPDIGIKTGWSSIGMAALNPRGEARAFIAWGDHSLRKEEWVVVTQPPAACTLEARVWYRVRHQVIVTPQANRVRYRIWRAEETEPSAWLCDETDAHIAPHLPRYHAGSFALFQHSGMPIEWGDVLVTELDA
jgi:hypothetical protein